MAAHGRGIDTPGRTAVVRAPPETPGGRRRDFWAGETTWFCCGAAWGPCASTGGGAWPNASPACWDITRPDLCGEGGIPRRGCGSVMNVRHQCSRDRLARGCPA